MVDRAPSLTRRGLLGGAVAVTAGAGAGALVAAVPSFPSEPVFAAISFHAAARARVDGIDEDHEEWEAALDEELERWEAFCAVRPASVAGLVAYAAHAASYADLRVLVASDGPAQIISHIAEALRELHGNGGEQ